MHEQLLTEIRSYVAELERKESTAIYAVPEEALKSVRRAKTLEKFLHGIFAQVSGSGGVQLLTLLRREFGIPAEAIERFERWAPYGKDRFKEELHDAVDRASLRAGNQGIFFLGTPGKREAEEALRLLRHIAHEAIEIQFAPGRRSPERHVAVLEGLLQFYALPNTYPEGTSADYRGLLSADRLAAVAEGDEAAERALRAFARSWYQRSGLTFLEDNEAYVDYREVPRFLYLLTEEQLERLRDGYVRSVEKQFRTLRNTPDLARGRALLDMLEEVLSWMVPNDETRGD